MWGKKEINFSRVAATVCSSPPCQKQFPFTFSVFIILLCARHFVGFAQSAWINVSDTKEWWSGDELLDPGCCGGIRDQLQHQQLVSACIPASWPSAKFWRQVCFLEVCWRQVGLDASSKGFLYQKYCCASALQLRVLQTGGEQCSRNSSPTGSNDYYSRKEKASSLHQQQTGENDFLIWRDRPLFPVYWEFLSWFSVWTFSVPTCRQSRALPAPGIRRHCRGTRAFSTSTLSLAR